MQVFGGAGLIETMVELAYVVSSRQYFNSFEGTGSAIFCSYRKYLLFSLRLGGIHPNSRPSRSLCATQVVGCAHGVQRREASGEVG